MYAGPIESAISDRGELVATEQREDPSNPPDTGWHSAMPGGNEGQKSERASYEPQSNGIFASLVTFAQAFYDPAFQDCLDEQEARHSIPPSKV